MTRSEFIALIGQDIVVDYPFFKETQQWSMKIFPMILIRTLSLIAVCP